jgi:hypothetical protein
MLHACSHHRTAFLTHRFHAALMHLALAIREAPFGSQAFGHLLVHLRHLLTRLLRGLSALGGRLLCSECCSSQRKSHCDDEKAGSFAGTGIHGNLLEVIRTEGFELSAP